MADERAVAIARRLEESDERVAAALADVRALDDASRALRDRAASLAALVASAPQRLDAAEAAVADAERELARRRDEAARAEGELAAAERSRDEQRLAAARRGVDRARESVGAGEKRLERAVAARADVERSLREAEAETPVVEAEAARLSSRLVDLPRLSRGGVERPEAGLTGVDEWASRVAAALFVVRSGLETERERLIREANELAASVLGEPASGTSVALVRARLERA